MTTLSRCNVLPTQRSVFPAVDIAGRSTASRTGMVDSGRLHGRGTFRQNMSALSLEASRQTIPSFSGLALQWNQFEQQLAVNSKTDLLNRLR